MKPRSKPTKLGSAFDGTASGTVVMPQAPLSPAPPKAKKPKLHHTENNSGSATEPLPTQPSATSDSNVDMNFTDPLGSNQAAAKNSKIDHQAGNDSISQSTAASIVSTEVSTNGTTSTSWECSQSFRAIADSHHGLDLKYYSNFFHHSDAKVILKQLEEDLPQYLDASRNEVKIMGRVCKIPRKQAAFGDDGLSYNFSGVSVPALPWTPLLKQLRDAVARTVGEQFNFVLVNRYKDGSDHIGEHRDDEKDLVPQSSIASLSFGQERDFVFKHKDSRGRAAKMKHINTVRLSLEHGSLLVMKYPTNTYWYHSLPPRKSIHRARVNLTFRVMRTRGPPK